MSESESNVNAAGTLPPPGKPSRWVPIGFDRLAAKELRETLRDRRTIVTLFLMPLLVYPILSLLFQGFFASGLQTTSIATAEGQFVFLFESEDEFARVANMLRDGFNVIQQFDAEREHRRAGETGPLPPVALTDLFERHIFRTLDKESGSTLEQAVQTEADVGIRVEGGQTVQGRQRTAQFELLYRDQSPRSLEAVKLLERILMTYNISALNQVMRSRGIQSRLAAFYEERIVEPSSKATISFAALVPLILTLMTITGAVYPAIDLTAGERERGTLESMIAAPIPRMRILIGKLVAVVSVAMLTALLNLIGMTITIWVFRLDTVLFGEQGLTLLMVAQILGLLVLFAGFFASVLLVISSFARSFKEGQAYLIPVMLVALAPGLISLKPGLELNSLWAITPLVNIVLLSRDVLQGNASVTAGIVTVGATMFYAALAITIAARFFGTANVLYGDSQGIGTLFRRPKEPCPVASASLAMLCLALLFPATFIWQGILARTVDPETAITQASELQSESVRQGQLTLVKQQSLLAAAGIIAVFFLVPLAIALFHRVRFLSGFRLRLPSFLGLLAAALLGVGLGPLLLQAIASSGQWIEVMQASGQDSRSELLEQAELQAAKLRLLPLWWVLGCFALVPAIFEELFFRGLLFQALRRAMSPWKTILTTGVMFGVFHLITASGIGVGRVLPTTIMGIILGWVCFRTGSVLPGMILHGIHNAMTLSVSYLRDDLIEWGWITADQQNVPVAILGGGMVLTVFGASLLLLRSRPREEFEQANSIGNMPSAAQ